MGQKFDMKATVKSLATTMKEAQASERIIELPLNEIEIDPNQPRREIDEETIKQLAASIEVQGVQQPIVVRRISDGTSGTSYRLMYGERRWRASKVAHKKTIPAVIREIGDDTPEKLLIRQTTENLQREDLSLNDLVSVIQTLRKTMTQDAIAKELGMDRSWVTKLDGVGKAGGTVAEALELKLTDDGETLAKLKRLEKLDGNEAAKQIRYAKESGAGLSRDRVKTALDRATEKSNQDPGDKSGPGQGRRPKASTKPSETTPASEGTLPTGNVFQAISVKLKGSQIVIETNHGPIIFDSGLRALLEKL